MALAALAIPAAGGGLDGGDAGARVAVDDYAFTDRATGTPLTRVPAGAAVVWVWGSGVHSATHGLAEPVDRVTGRAWDSGVLATTDDPPATFRHTFREEGLFPYFCVVHDWMRGAVLVEA